MLAAMIFAVAMTFIDQTIVSIAIPELQKDLSLSSTGVQWVVNGYLLALSALFAFGGRLADIAGHRRMVTLGVVIFATASALCGATPSGSLDEVWLITFRVIQGAGAAIMFPAALAIVIAAFPISERGKAMAIFFAVAGGLTSVGPIAGGYLTEIDWRAIFWVNIPVALIALLLTWRARPANERHPAPIDYRGTVLISAGMGLAVLGLQQSATWGWGDPATWGCIVGGLALLAAFVVYQLRVPDPLLRVRIFTDRAFAMENVVLFLLMIPFVPLFFFSSLYSQISLGYDASNAGLYLLIFFAGFATASQIGGRILDTRGARPSVVVGCAVAAIGFVLAGAGVGLVLGPANTDAINRAPRTSYGEATGITQTVRNFGSSLGLAVMGSVLILENKSNIEASFSDLNIPQAKADEVADSLSQGGSGAGRVAESLGARAQDAFGQVPHDFALASRTVFYIMAGVMAIAFVVALLGLPAGRAAGKAEAGDAETPGPDATPASAG